jgi:spore coat protein CotH
MFEDEMTEDHIVRTIEEYDRVTQQEIHDEQIAAMRAYISALEAQVLLLKTCGG